MVPLPNDIAFELIMFSLICVVSVMHAVTVTACLYLPRSLVNTIVYLRHMTIVIWLCPIVIT